MFSNSPPTSQIPLGNSSPCTNIAAHEQDASSREEAIPNCTARQPPSGGVEGRHSARPKACPRQHTPPSSRSSAEWGAQARNIVNASGTDAGLIRYTVRNLRAFGIDAVIRCPAAAIGIRGAYQGHPLTWCEGAGRTYIPLLLRFSVFFSLSLSSYISQIAIAIDAQVSFCFSCSELLYPAR